LDVIHIPLPDFGIPDDLESWQAGLDAAVAAARRGKNIAVHCLAGVGRTGIFMACLAKEVLGLEGLEAIEWVRESLRGAMENWRQEEFVIGYQSGRSG
jgi:protein-tyrosine phosphatase